MIMKSCTTTIKEVLSTIQTLSGIQLSYNILTFHAAVEIDLVFLKTVEIILTATDPLGVVVQMRHDTDGEEEIIAGLREYYTAKYIDKVQQLRNPNGS